MKLMKWLLLISIIAACSAKPQPINYGHDACVFCQMTIVDKQHAAEIVTVKGKVYKYDAIECMLNDYKKWKRPEVALFLVNDYATPGELIEAQNASYLISEEIPSPMGEFLTAFGEAADLQSLQIEQGEHYNWSQLQSRFQP